MNIDGLYTLLKKDENNVHIELSSEQHPIFQAHFPSNPILPAFIHFEIISEVFNITITQIKKAKFTEIVTPNTRLEYKKKNNTFSIFSNDKKVASLGL